VVGVGSASPLRPRLDWVAGALRAGGFRVAGNEILPADAVADAALAAGAAVMVLCAADEDYPELVPKVVERLGKGRARIAALALAGPPPEGEPAWVGACGVDLFLHRKTDLVAALGELQRKAGVAP
jgi:methylmalonyl-CoA mutase